MSDAIEGPAPAPSRAEIFSSPESIADATSYGRPLQALDRRTSSLSGLVMGT